MSNHWPIVQLSEVLRQEDTSVPVSELGEVRLAGVYSFARGLFKRGPMSPADTSYKTYNRLVADDFVISVPKAWEGALARVTPEFEGWFLSPVFPTFRADRVRLEPAFLEWFCKRASVWAQLQLKSRGIGARRESVHPEQFLSLEIPLPPLCEQRRIVTRIEELAAQINEARTLRQQAAEQADILSAKTAAVIFDRLKCTTKPLGLVATKRTGIAYRAEDFSDSNGVPVVRLKEIQTKNPTVFLRNPETYSNVWLEMGDIVLAKTSFSTGAMCQWPGPRAVLNQNAVALRAKDDIDQRFLFAWLGQQVSRYLSETLAGANFYPYIRESDLVRWEVPVPPIYEQQRIVAELDALQAELDALKRLQAETATELDALLPAILDRAFKGEL